MSSEAAAEIELGTHPHLSYLTNSSNQSRGLLCCSALRSSSHRLEMGRLVSVSSAEAVCAGAAWVAVVADDSLRS